MLGIRAECCSRLLTSKNAGVDVGLDDDLHTFKVDPIARRIQIDPVAQAGSHGAHDHLYRLDTVDGPLEKPMASLTSSQAP
tara:strand:- start:370 stop:612 length:243 start_codon:yes stop_codon:yes gene_type:complete